MEWIKNDVPDNVKDIVVYRTKMDESCLLKDTRRYKINNLSKAADKLWQFHMAGRLIVNYSDYDADGIGAGIIMNLLFRFIDCKNFKVIIPRRHSDGFGIRESAIDDIPPGSLIITTDNGIAATGPINLAKEKGITVIVTDHHQPVVDTEGNQVLPDADIIIDPHVTGGDFEDYCGAGIAFRLAQEVLQTMPHQKSLKEVSWMLGIMCSIAAVSTVADSVSLTWENRRIVRNGLKMMQKKISPNGVPYRVTTTGMDILLHMYYLDEHITATDLGFRIGPAYNAYGRLDDEGSRKVMQALCYTGKFYKGIENDVKELYDKNQERKEKTALGQERADNLILQTKQANNSFIVIYDPLCELGIAGIISGRITEKYGVPSIVLCNVIDQQTGKADPNLIKGSGRSVGWCNLKKTLDLHQNLIYRYGGHPAACGITLEKSKLDEFRMTVNDTCNKMRPVETNNRKLFYDLDISEDEAADVMKQIELYGPYGEGNPEIKVCIRNLELIPGENGYMSVNGKNKNNLRLTSRKLNLLMFNGVDYYCVLGEPKKISVIGTLSLHYYRGQADLQLIVDDMICADPGLPQMDLQSRLNRLLEV